MFFPKFFNELFVIFHFDRNLVRWHYQSPSTVKINVSLNNGSITSDTAQRRAFNFSFHFLSSSSIRLFCLCCGKNCEVWGFINLKAFTECFRSPLRPITLSSITTNLNYDKCCSRNFEIEAEGKVFCLLFICFHFPFHQNFPSPALFNIETNKTSFFADVFFLLYIKELMDVEVVYNLPRWIFSFS